MTILSTGHQNRDNPHIRTEQETDSARLVQQRPNPTGAVGVRAPMNTRHCCIQAPPRHYPEAQNSAETPYPKA